jgi:subfamily B ATP-binding cassette protein MsbA
MLKIIQKLLPYLRPYFKYVIGSLLFSFALAGIKGYQAYLVKPLFDQGLNKGASFNDALKLAGLLLGVGILNFPCRFFHFYWIRSVVEKVVCDIREDIFKKFQRLPLSFYVKNKQGALVSNVLNDTSMFASGLRNAIDLVREPLTAIVMFSLALYRDWQLTLVIVVTTPLFLLVFGKSGRLIRRNQSEVQEKISLMTHAISEGLLGQKIAKAFNLQDYVLGRFLKSQITYFSSQLKTMKIEEVAHPLVELVGAIAFSGVIIFAHHRITSGALSTGDFVSFITALALLMDPIRKFSQANVKINQSVAAGERILGLLAQPEEMDIGQVEKKSFETRITVKNLSFSYDGENSVIKNLNLYLGKGEKVALVGLSGSGKSTLINLLLGLYPYEQGEITIDGIALPDIKLTSLRDILGLVSQDIFLFNDTIRENICVGKKYSEEEIRESLRVSYCDEFVYDLPQGLDTIVGDHGARLSGGQKQRITIARAFLRNPDVFLFDEATSALDNTSEKVVQRALEQISGDKSVLAIAHRLTTVQNYDRIYVMKDGEVVEVGTHESLMGLQGEYYKLYSLSLGK